MKDLLKKVLDYKIVELETKYKKLDLELARMLAHHGMGFQRVSISCELERISFTIQVIRETRIGLLLKK